MSSITRPSVFDLVQALKALADGFAADEVSATYKLGEHVLTLRITGGSLLTIEQEDGSTLELGDLGP